MRLAVPPSASGSDFSTFGATCGNTRSGTTNAGRCEQTQTQTPFGGPAIPNSSPIAPISGATQDKSVEIGVVSLLFGTGYLGTLFVLDRARWRGVATAFVIPGFVALTTGAQSLGNAAHHAWVGGSLTFVAGLFVGVIGDRTGRRFTTWTGGVTASLGAIIVALDAAHISRAGSHGHLKLAGPGLIIISFGVGLVATGFIVAQILRSSAEPPAPEAAPPTPPSPASGCPSETGPSWPPAPSTPA